MPEIYSIKSAELPIGGYKLIVRGPTLHQHEALVEAFYALDLGPVWKELQPILETARKGETAQVIGAVGDALPSILAAFRQQVLIAGMRSLVHAAAGCLDTRANLRRLAGDPIDPDYDKAPVTVEEADTSPDGTHLRCESLRAFVASELTIDAALWVVQQAIVLGGYADLGKALMARLSAATQVAAQMAPKTPEKVTA